MSLDLLYRIEKMSIGVSSVTPSNRLVRFTIRDATTGLSIVENRDVPLTTLNDAALLSAYICTQFNGVYTPNDFGCA